MRISFSPQRRDDSLAVSKAGDILTINGEEFDFSGVPDGATLPADAIDCTFVAGSVERIDGDLHVTLILPHGSGPSPAVAYPADIIDPADGALELPQ
jgi:hypothetical protein